MPSKGFIQPIKEGQVVEVSDPLGEEMLAMVNIGPHGVEVPMFSADVTADVEIIAHSKELTLEEAINEQKEDAKKVTKKRASSKGTRSRKKTTPKAAE